MTCSSLPRLPLLHSMFNVVGILLWSRKARLVASDQCSTEKRYTHYGVHEVNHSGLDTDFRFLLGKAKGN